jgi:hypothetical protein
MIRSDPESVTNLAQTWGPSCFEPSHLRLRLLQPEAHVHIAVHCRGGGEVLLRFLPLARPLGELAKSKVAPGHEWAHPELGGELHCLLDMRPGRLRRQGDHRPAAAVFFHRQ